MKRLLFIALAALALLATGANAATTTSTFNVKLTLNSKCYVNILATGPSSQTTTDVSFTYNAFQTSDGQGSTSFNVRCTNTLPYSIDVANQADVAAGVNYYLKLVAGSAASYVTAATVGASSLSSLTGSGSDQAYTVGVDAPSGQAGTCATASCLGTTAHTITVTY